VIEGTVIELLQHTWNLIIEEETLFLFKKIHS